MLHYINNLLPKSTGLCKFISNSGSGQPELRLGTHFDIYSEFYTAQYVYEVMAHTVSHLALPAHAYLEETEETYLFSAVNRRSHLMHGARVHMAKVCISVYSAKSPLSQMQSLHYTKSISCNN